MAGQGINQVRGRGDEELLPRIRERRGAWKDEDEDKEEGGRATIIG